MTLLFSPIIGVCLQPGPIAASSASADSGEVMVWLLVAAVVIGVVVAALVVVNRAIHKRRTSSHAGLFAGLCQHHKLDRNRRNLLKALGQAHRVRYPARVFLDPTLFDPKRLPPGLQGKKEEILAFASAAVPGAGGAPPPRVHS